MGACGAQVRLVSAIRLGSEPERTSAQHLTTYRANVRFVCGEDPNPVSDGRLLFSFVAWWGNNEPTYVGPEL